MTEFTIRGLPKSIANDGWWLACTTASEPLEKQPRAGRSDKMTKMSRNTFLLVAALMLLADFLFWEHSIGVSLVIYSAALSRAAIASLRPQFTVVKWGGIASIWIVCALPVVEYTQFMSVSILVAGHLGLLVWCAMQSTALGSIIRNLIRLPYLLPAFSFLSSLAAIRTARMPGELKPSREAVMVWLLPLIVGSVFLQLFVGANPVFEQWLDQATRLNISVGDPSRVVFWSFIAFAVYPFVAFINLSKSFKSGPTRRFSLPKSVDGIINARSITISLFLFNAMFLTQNATDIAFLWGSAALPEGLTYAQYAQAGAYPLMATSILAGLFVLISRGFITSAPLLKLLLFVWILQNIFLVSSALTRLGLYIDVYGLTYLRIRAGIGMGLVLAGMALLAWQLWFSKSNTWVSALFAGVCATTIYAGCFVNFGYVIARENLTRGADGIDEYYLCQNTTLVMNALVEHAKETGTIFCRHSNQHHITIPQGWRSWGLRETRLFAAHHNYLTLIEENDVTSIKPSTRNRSGEKVR
ncbi:MAG: DUF4173 domain-containing protein [Sulfitobacter sp.]